MPDLLLEATGVAKRYGAVAALRSASLSVRAGRGPCADGRQRRRQEHARQDPHRRRPPGRRHRSPSAASRTSPAPPPRPGAAASSPSTRSRRVIPDLDIRSNLRLTKTPVEPFRHWLAELGIADLDLSDMARDLPLATLRVIDLARALAIEPHVLHARRDDRRPAGRPDRAGAPRHRQSARVGPLHHLHLAPPDRDRGGVRSRHGPARRRDGRRRGHQRGLRGADRRADARRVVRASPKADARRRARASAAAEAATPRLAVRELRVGHATQGRVLRAARRRGPRASPPSRARARTSCSMSSPARAAPTAASSWSTARPVSFRHPADAIRAGLVYVPADRAEALLMQRSVRENVALPSSRGVRSLGPDRMAAEATRVDAAVERLQIDTRAASEVRRLSGGNQQKVTIARWVAGGVQTMLCFDPTRGIDIGTKQQIYELRPRAGRRRRRGPLLHLGAQGGPARLRPGDRHLRWPDRGRDRRSTRPTSPRCCAPPTTCRRTS